MPTGRGRRTALNRRLTPEQQHLLQLTQQVRSPTITPQLRLRARIVLLLAEGQTITAIAQQVSMARKIIYKWLRRWEAEGLKGLQDRKPGYPVRQKSQAGAPTIRDVRAQERRRDAGVFQP